MLATKWELITSIMGVNRWYQEELGTSKGGVTYGINGCSKLPYWSLETIKKLSDNSQKSIFEKN